MADDLPTLNPQPDSSVVSPDQLAALQHASRWAGTFGGQDTNISERANHNQDISNYADALAQTRAAAQQQLIQSNQTAQNLWLGTQRLQLQQQQADMHMAVQQAQLAATSATERRKAAEAMAMANDTASFNQHVSDMITSGVKPQSPEWQAGLADGLAQFSHANPVDVTRFGAQLFPGQKLTPEEYIAKAVALKTQATAAGLQNPQVHEFQGTPNVVEGTPAHTQDPNIRLGHLESLRAKATDPNIVSYLDNEILSAHAELKGAPPAVAPDAQAAPASFDSPDAFTAAFKAAPAGSVLHYQGKPYRKP